MTYATSGTEIIHQLLDDEVIVANLDAGIYYSIRGAGSCIWQLLLAGYTVDSIEALFVEQYGPIPSISPFVERLADEKLLVPKERAAFSPITLSWPESFVLPTLERYDEMKNLLMLDPIHEVDEQGWPHRK